MGRVRCRVRMRVRSRVPLETHSRGEGYTCEVTCVDDVETVLLNMTLAGTNIISEHIVHLLCE